MVMRSNDWSLSEKYGEQVSVSKDKVLNSFSVLVEGGGGKETWLMDKTERYIKEARVPNVQCRRVKVNTGFFGPEREFLQVTHDGLREYAVYIGARNYGAHLDVSCFLTCTPGFFKRQFSKYTLGNPMAMSREIDLFPQQDLNAYSSMAKYCLDNAIEELRKELGQDYTRPDTKSKGFLSEW